MDKFQSCERKHYEASISLLMVQMPGVAKRTTSVVCCTKERSSTTEIRNLIRYLESLIKQVGTCRKSFQAFQSAPRCKGCELLDQNADTELIGMSYGLEILFRRFLTAVSPSQRVSAETSAQILAAEAVELFRTTSRTQGRAVFFLGQKVKVAEATIKTAMMWKTSRLLDQAIEPAIFRHWCKLMARKVPDIIVY